MPVKYTWHSPKNEKNKRLHGLDFADFNGWTGDVLTFEDDREDYDETRWIDVGRIGLEVFQLVYTVIPPLMDEDGTILDDEEMVRIISWRRISEQERKLYERLYG